MNSKDSDEKYFVLKGFMAQAVFQAEDTGGEPRDYEDKIILPQFPPGESKDNCFDGALLPDLTDLSLRQIGRLTSSCQKRGDAFRNQVKSCE